MTCISGYVVGRYTKIGLTAVAGALAITGTMMLLSGSHVDKPRLAATLTAVHLPSEIPKARPPVSTVVTVPVRTRLPAKSGPAAKAGPTTTAAAPAARAAAPVASKAATPVAGPPAVHAATTTQPSPAPEASTAAACTEALAYLAAHAKPGFAHYCRPGLLNLGVAHTVAFTCVPGTHFSCPDGVPEIIIADPTCAISYENEASNSYWNFSTGGLIVAGSVQNGRTWDPYGECP